MGRHDDEHLRRFLAARKAGDAVAMRRWWEELVIDFADRMSGLVMANHKGRLDRDEHEEAVQRAMVRFSENLIETFRGGSMGELVNATKALCRFVCIDVQDDAVRERERAFSLDAERPAGEDKPAPRWEADAAREAHAFAESASDVDEFLAWALPQLIDARRRVFERTLDGVPVDEICAELDVSRDNAYQLRSRAQKDLAKLYIEYASS